MHEEGLYVPLYVKWLDNRKVVAAGPAERGLHVTAMCFAKRLAEDTDGWVHRALLRRDGFDDELIDRGVALDLLDVDGDSVRPHGWHRRNPSQGAITASRASKSEAGRRGNHKRHGHADAFEECTICHPAKGTPSSSQGAIADRRTAVAPDRTSSPETETETETETSLLSSQSDSQGEVADADEEENRIGTVNEPPAPPGDPSRLRRAEAICDAIATTAHDRRVAAGGVTFPASHLRACIDGARRDHLEVAQKLIHDHPDWDDERIAAELVGPPPIETTAVPIEESRHPSVLAQRLREAEVDDEPAADPETVQSATEAARQALQDAARRRADREHPETPKDAA